MTRKPLHADRPGRLRRLRSVAAFVVASLAAPLGLVAVAASPAAAAPVTIHVAGDPGTVNFGAWVWDGSENHYRELQWRLFGGGPAEYPQADFGDATFVNDGGMSPLALTDSVDVFFSGAVDGGYSPAEEAALMAWVQAGGVLIANPQTADLYNTTDFLPGTPTLRVPVAQWEEQRQPEPSDPPEDPPPPPLPDTHTCQMNVPAGTCVGLLEYHQKHSAPQPAAVVSGDNPTVAQLLSNDHGTVTSIRNWHTVTTFTKLPTSAVAVANLNVTCTAATTACSGSPGGGAFAYDNTIAGPVVAVVPFGTPGYGSGAVVVTSDGDVFSNAYGPMEEGNYTLALNMFQWIGDHFSELAEPPPPVVPGAAADATGRYNPVTPDRVYDTRNGIGVAPGKVNGGESRTVQITGLVGVPVDATAVALNVTATNQAGAGFLTVYPTGGGRPETSNLNIPAEAKAVANAVAVRIGDGGKVTIFNSNNATDVIVDVVGYWSTTVGNPLKAVDTPTRIYDTRKIGSPVGEGQARTVQVTGTYPITGVTIPADATGVVANVTATNGTRGGFLTVFPSGSVPTTSSVNFLPNTNVPNLVFAPLAADGTIKIHNEFGTTDVIVDVVGYFGPSGDTRLAAVTPDRMLNTRATGKVSSNGTVTFDVRGLSGVDPSAQSVLLNVTVNEPVAAGYLTVFPGGPLPEASNLNFVAGQTVPNLVLARIGSDGKVRITNTSPGASHILADVFAWFGPGV